MMEPGKENLTRAQVIERLSHFIAADHAEAIYDRYHEPGRRGVKTPARSRSSWRSTRI